MNNEDYICSKCNDTGFDKNEEAKCFCDCDKGSEMYDAFLRDNLDCCTGADLIRLGLTMNNETIRGE